MASFTLFYEYGLRSWAPVVQLAVYTAVLVPFLVLFMRRRDQEPLRSRSSGLVLFQIGMMFCLNVLDTVAIVVNGSGLVPDGYHYGASILFWFEAVAWIPLGYLPFVVRGWRLYYQYMRGNLMVAESRISMGMAPGMTMLRFHDVAVRYSKGIITSFWAAVFIGLPFVVGWFILLAIYVTGVTSMEAAITWTVLSSVIYIYALGTTVTALVWIASAADVFSIRNEFVFLLIAHVPMVILELLALFSYIPMSYSAFHLYGAWMCLLGSIVYPVLLTFRFQWEKERLLKSLQRKDAAASGTATPIEGGIPRSPSRLNIGMFRSDPLIVRFLLSCFGMRIASERDMFHESPEYGHSSDLDSSTNGPTTTSPGDRDAEDQQNNAIEHEIQLLQLNSEDRRKESKGSDKIHLGGGKRKFILSKLMDDPHEYQRLLDLAIKCFSVELILFLTDLGKFYAAQTVPERVAIAHTLINRYIHEGAPRQLNLVAGTRKATISTFEKLPPHADETEWDTLDTIFKDAEHEVKILIQTNILPLWRREDKKPAATTAEEQVTSPV